MQNSNMHQNHAAMSSNPHNVHSNLFPTNLNQFAQPSSGDLQSTNETDCNQPQSYDVNLFHLVEVVYPARIKFDKTKVNFKHEFDSCGNERTIVYLKIQCRESGPMRDDFYKHLMSSKCKCMIFLVNI